jgi:hypothetical protein
MPEQVYELPDWEAWEIPGDSGRPSSLRITTDIDLPFHSSALLYVQLGAEGLEFLDADRRERLVLGREPGPELHALFFECTRYFLPVVLTEVDFAGKRQRTWLAAPRKRPDEAFGS